MTAPRNKVLVDDLPVPAASQLSADPSGPTGGFQDLSWIIHDKLHRWFRIGLGFCSLRTRSAIQLRPAGAHVTIDPACRNLFVGNAQSCYGAQNCWSKQPYRWTRGFAQLSIGTRKMDLKPGTRWASQVCDTEVIVVRISTTEVTLECGGHPMTPVGAERSSDLALDFSYAQGSPIGKRFGDPTAESSC